MPYRYFFTGLNKEIVKRGVTGSADAFAFEEKMSLNNSVICPPDGFLTSVFDSALLRTVTQLTYSMVDDSLFEVYEDFPTTKKTASFWVKRSAWENDDVLVGFHVNTSAGERHVELIFSRGTDELYTDGTEKYHKLYYSTLPQSKWQRVEVDLSAIVARESGVSYTGTSAMYISCVDSSFSPVRFSNSYTLTYNSLLPNALNPVASVKIHTSDGGKITASTSWLHYNHIGNVMRQSNATGTGWTTQYMDAFGNAMTQASANSTGAHTSLGTAALGITAKPYDATARAYYFYQRWYDHPKVGAFTSWDPNPPYDQLPYGFVEGNPVEGVDMNGEAANCGFVIHPDNYMSPPQYVNGYINDALLFNSIVGFGDAASFGLGLLIRDYLTDLGVFVDTTSIGYNLGGIPAMFIGGGRVAYAGSVKVYSCIAPTATAASRFRESAKLFFRGGFPSDYHKFVNTKNKIGDELRRSSGITNIYLDILGAIWLGSGSYVLFHNEDKRE